MMTVPIRWNPELRILGKSRMRKRARRGSVRGAVSIGCPTATVMPDDGLANGVSPKSACGKSRILLKA